MDGANRCAYCGISFDSEESLNKHIVSVHNAGKPQNEPATDKGRLEQERTVPDPGSIEDPSYSSDSGSSSSSDEGFEDLGSSGWTGVGPCGRG
jgi:hypothetical protein